MISAKPILFLLNREFRDPSTGPGEFYCPYCLRIEGMLAAFPMLHDELDIRYVGFAKPRGQLPELAGDDNQSCPQIVLEKGDDGFAETWSILAKNGGRRIDDTTGIEDYLSARFGLPKRHP